MNLLRYQVVGEEFVGDSVHTCADYRCQSTVVHSKDIKESGLLDISFVVEDLEVAFLDSLEVT